MSAEMFRDTFEKVGRGLADQTQRLASPPCHHHHRFILSFLLPKRLDRHLPCTLLLFLVLGIGLTLCPHVCLLGADLR